MAPNGGPSHTPPPGNDVEPLVIFCCTVEPRSGGFCRIVAYWRQAAALQNARSGDPSEKGEKMITCLLVYLSSLVLVSSVVLILVLALFFSISTQLKCNKFT